MRYVLNMTVRSVEHKQELVRAWKDDRGDVHTETKPRGWFVILDPGGLAVLLGDDEPELAPNQKVKVSIDTD